MKTFLSLQECLGQQQIDRYYHANPPPYSPNVVNQTVDYGGITWKGQPGGQWQMQSMTGGQPIGGNSTTSAPSFQDVLGNAGSLNAQLQQNIQPAVTTAQTAGSNLQQRYQDLIANIIGPGSQIAVNQATNVTNQVLGARGIDSSQGYGAQQIQQALLPVQAQYGGLAANTGISAEQAALQNAQYISQLQNTFPEAIGAAFGLANTQIGVQPGIMQAQNQAALIPSEIQTALANQALLGAQTKQANYLPVSAGQNLYNVSGNSYSNAIPSLLASLGMRLQNGQLVPF